MMNKSKWALRALALATAFMPVIAVALADNQADGQAVPEPETLALLGIAGAAVVAARWLRRK